MKKKQKTPKGKSGGRLPQDSFNRNLSAIPHDTIQVDAAAANPDESAAMEYGEMNAEDAKNSGYTDEKGRAVEKARKNVPGSPTGALTDVGAGRSSAVRRH